MAINYRNRDIINRLLETTININNTNNDLGLTALHQSIILDNYELFIKLLNKNANINITDFYGNTPLHYILIDKKNNYLNSFFKKDDIKFNMSNINGDIPLHLLFTMNIDDISDNIINKFLIESDLNIQNNEGQTCLMKIVENNLVKKFRDILIIKPLNFYIEDNNFETIKLTDELISIIVDSYYYQIKQNKENLIIDWERWCSVDLVEKLKTLTENNGSKTPEETCKKKIKNIIVKEKRTLPKLTNIKLNLDNGIFTNFCFYTGMPIDILFGLLLLHNDFLSNGLNIILDYPLTVNEPLEKYYKKIGLDYPYKIDFSNIEIIWSYQKIFYPSYFDHELEMTLKKAKYIVIPIGIETSAGSHANILFWDVKNKIVERFEPNGSNYPSGLNYNPELLDNLLIDKIKQFVSDIEYRPPYNFLPPIGFQILENLETEKCKKIGDPNGFCGVWCVWWVYQRMLNMTNQNLTGKNIAEELIKFIKFDNQSFKAIIRNFSKKITQIRDAFLKKQNIDINDWIVANYTVEQLNNIETHILKTISKIN